MQNLLPKSKPSPKNKPKKANVRYNALNSGNRKYTESSASRMALMHSRYLNSVLDPFNECGARIPDEITAPSFPSQTIIKYIATAQPASGAGNVGTGLAVVVGQATSTYALKLCSLLPNAVANQYVTGNISTAWPGGSQIVTIGSMARIVSAALSVQVLGSLNNNQGRILIGYLPPGSPLQSISTATTVTLVETFAQATYLADIPASKVIGRALWLPLDDIARSYCPPGFDTKTAARGQVSSGFSYQFGQLFCIVDGLTAGVQVEFQIAENWEIIPASNQLNIVQANASKSDPLEMACASNFLADNPTVAQHQPESLQITGTPSSGMVHTGGRDAGPSFLDSVMSGLSGGLKVAKKIAPFAAELLALL